MAFNFRWKKTKVDPLGVNDTIIDVVDCFKMLYLSSLPLVLGSRTYLAFVLYHSNQFGVNNCLLTYYQLNIIFSSLN